MTYVCGLDLGQVNDFTALVVVEVDRLEDGAHRHRVRHIERVRQVSYPEVVQKVDKILSAPPLDGNSLLVIDKTGVGRGVTDLFRAVSAQAIVGITITAGNTVGREGRDYTVPKKDLVAALHAAGGRRSLRYSRWLRHGDILDGELAGFRMKRTATTVLYDTWREGQHDDVLLALSLAVWYTERPRQRWGGHS